nr:carbohydrate ABC transporter substrate-binding protein [Paracoccaceae bacterium]
HAILHFLALAVAFGEPPASRDPELLVPEATGREALALMRALHARRVRAADGKNPIAILDAMAGGAEIALCPLIYGYVPYARAEAGRQPLRFTDAPVTATGGRPGSVLGGTGIAISIRCTPPPALIAHLEWLMSPETQADFIPSEAGQPGLRSAWEDDGVNRAWGGFYRAIARTLDSAWVRPRHPGWIAFQTEASALLRDALESGAPDAAVLGRLQDRYAVSRAGGEEI